MKTPFYFLRLGLSFCILLSVVPASAQEETERSLYNGWVKTSGYLVKWDGDTLVGDIRIALSTEPFVVAGEPIHTGYVHQIQFFNELGEKEKFDATEVKEFGKFLPENEKKVAFQTVREYNKAYAELLDKSGEESDLESMIRYLNMDSVLTSEFSVTHFHRSLKRKKNECELLGVYQAQPHFENPETRVFNLTHLIRVKND